MWKNNTILETEIFYGASPEIFKRASELRKNMTEAEKKLWSLIRKRQIQGKRFRRQHPVNSFIVDFYCHEIKLVIEVDGSIHQFEEQKEYDTGRTDKLQSFGISVIRFTNEQVIKQPDMVIKEIEETIKLLEGKAR